MFCVILSSKSGGVCGWLNEVGILDAHGVCCFSVIKPGKYGVSCCAASEYIAGMYPRTSSLISDLIFKGLSEKACSSIQRSRRQAGGAMCFRMARAVICKSTCAMFMFFCSLKDQV